MTAHGKDDFERARLAFSRERLFDLALNENWVKERHQSYRTICPRNHGGTGNISFSKAKDGSGYFKCWHNGCDLKGDVVNLLMQSRGLSKADALRAALELAGEPWAPKKHEDENESLSPADVDRVWKALANDGSIERAYLRSRSLETALDRGLVRVSNGDAPNDWVRRMARAGYRVAMAIYNPFGELVSVQFRAIRPLGLDRKGKPYPTKKSLRGASYYEEGGFLGQPLEARKAPEVCICEGIADTLAVLLLDRVTVGVPGIDLLEKVLGCLGNVRDRRFLLFVQNDPPKVESGKQRGLQSQTAFGSLADQLRARGADVRLIRTPDGFKDPAEWRHAVGEEAFRAGVEAAAAAPVIQLPVREPGDDSDVEGEPADIVELREKAKSPAAAPSSDPRPLVQIRTEEREVNEIVIEALAKDPSIYQRAGTLVHVVRDLDALDAHGRKRAIHREIESPRIQEIPQAVLREHLSAAVRWEKFDGRKEDWVASHPPEWSTRAIHARRQWKGIRYLRGIIETPAMRLDGSILQTPGYDAASGLFFEPSIDFPPIPEYPTREDALAALAELREIYCDFPFAQPMHEAACIASLLTPPVRHACASPVPITVVRGNIRSSGKTLLVDTIGGVHTGRRLPRTPNTRKDEEMQKKITSIAMAGDPLVLLDNVKSGSEFGTESLDSALTTMTWADRLLSTNLKPTYPLLTQWFATGNNISFVGDMVRRTLLIEFESGLEHPEDRPEAEFRHGAGTALLDWVCRERGRLVKACLTVVRAFVVAGRPTMGLVPWSSFEDWSRLVRNCVVWLGMPDPMVAQRMIEATADTDVIALRGLVQGLSEMLVANNRAGKGMTSREIIAAIDFDSKRVERETDESKKVERYQALRAALDEVAPPLPGKASYDPRRVGNAFKNYGKRVSGGRRIEQNGTYQNYALWRVVDASGRPLGESNKSGESRISDRGEVSETDRGDSFIGSANETSPDPRHSPSELFDDSVYASAPEGSR